MKLKTSKLMASFKLISEAVRSASGNESSAISFKQTSKYFKIYSIYSSFSIAQHFNNKSKPWNYSITLDSKIVAPMFKNVAIKDIVEIKEPTSSSSLTFARPRGNYTFNAITSDSADISYLDLEFTDISSALDPIQIILKPILSIKDLNDYSKFVNIECDGNYIYACMGDGQHLFFLKRISKVKPFKACMPIELAKIISNNNITKLQLSEEGNFIRAKGVYEDITTIIEVQLSAPEKVLEVDKIKPLLEAKSKASFVVDRKLIIDTIQSVAALSNNMEINIAKKKVIVKAVSAEYEAEQYLDIDNLFDDCKVIVNTKYLLECLRGYSSKDITFSVIGNALTLFEKPDTKTTIFSLVALINSKD